MKHHSSHYRSFGIELAVDGLIMFIVMYSMVAYSDHVLLNTNNLFMTLMMVAPMGMVMLFAMRHMYSDRKLNAIIYAALAFLFLFSLYGMRTQFMVGDEQFLRAMIPHHSGALLMCGEAKLSDPEIISLCKGIVESQQQEIDQMKTILQRL